MGNVLEFFVKMKDLMSSGLVKIAQTSDKSFAKVQSAVDRVHSGLDKLKSKIGDVDQAASKSSFFNGGLLKRLALTAAITAGAGMVAGAAKDSYSAALTRTGVSNAINTTTKGQGAEAMAQTKSIADKYGINYNASLEGVKTLTGGLMSMNMPLKEQMKIFEGVSTGVAAMGLTADQSKGALLALGQMASKGTVSAEELRGQLGERIPGAFGLAAKAMGVTEARLGKMMENGEVAAKEFLPKLAAEMQKTFGADALKNANGPQAVMERFNNAIAESQVLIGQGLIPIITPVLQMLTQMASDVMPLIVSGFQFIQDGIANILSPTSEWSFWIDYIKGVLALIWSAVSYVGAIVWNIVKSLFMWAGKSELIKDAFRLIAEYAGWVVDFIKGVANVLAWVFNNIIMPILNAIEAVYKWVKGLLNGGKEIKVVGEVGGTIKNTTVTLADAAKLPGESKMTPAKIAGAGGAVGAVNPGKGKTDEVSKGITSAGPRTINISIGKLVERIEVHASNVDEGINNIESKVQEALLRILNSGAAIQ